MKRKESKIPLLVTAIILCYFVFWAIGYINRNRTPEVTPPPVADLAKPVNITENQPAEVQPPVIETQPQSANPSTEVQESKSLYSKKEAPVSATNNNNTDVVNDHGVQNRKIMGIAHEMTDKH